MTVPGSLPTAMASPVVLVARSMGVTVPETKSASNAVASFRLAAVVMTVPVAPASKPLPLMTARSCVKSVVTSSGAVTVHFRVALIPASSREGVVPV